MAMFNQYTPAAKNSSPFVWALLPFGYLLTCVFGIWVWLMLGSLFLSFCPAEKIWYGLASGDMKCKFPLWVFVLKDMLGVSFLAFILVSVTAWLAPQYKRTSAYTAAAISSLLGAWYLWHSFNPWVHVLSHRITVGVTFSCILLLTAIFIPKYLRHGLSHRIAVAATFTLILLLIATFFIPIF